LTSLPATRVILTSMRRCFHIACARSWNKCHLQGWVPWRSARSAHFGLAYCIWASMVEFVSVFLLGDWKFPANCTVSFDVKWALHLNVVK
jgi:hypothetical protein